VKRLAEPLPYLLLSLSVAVLLWPLASQTRIARAANPISPQAASVLQQIKADDREQLSVSEADGRFLQTLIVSSGSRRALEIGAADGYSAIWIGLGLAQTGGRLITIEYDGQRALRASENIRRAGLERIVTVVAGNAFDRIPAIGGSFDFVFLDAWKPDYRRFLSLLMPRLSPRGLFLAHNVVNKASEMREFLDAIGTDPRLLTSIVQPSAEGMSISVKLH
jgi:predicted O-methyltransferase YrrM